MTVPVDPRPDVLVRKAVEWIRDEWDAGDHLIGDSAEFVPQLERLATMLEERAFHEAHPGTVERLRRERQLPDARPMADADHALIAKYSGIPQEQVATLVGLVERQLLERLRADAVRSSPRPPVRLTDATTEYEQVGLGFRDCETLVANADIEKYPHGAANALGEPVFRRVRDENENTK